MTFTKEQIENLKIVKTLVILIIKSELFVFIIIYNNIIN